MRPVVIRENGVDFHAWLVGLEMMSVADDGAFLLAASKAKEHTGMDEMRLAMLWQCVLETRHCGSADVIEVGCGKGGSALLISSAMKAAGIGARLTLVDTFAGIVKSGPMDHHKDGEMNESSAAEVQALLPHAKVVKAVFPDEFSSEESYRFAHIDVDTYASALESFECLAHRMVSGAIIVMDDYGNNTTPGIRMAVERLQSPNIRWIYPGTRQALAVFL